MQFEITSPAGENELERNFKVTVPAEDVTKAYNEELNKAQKTARVDGFRKGKVPMQMIQKLYGASAFSSVVNKLIETSSQEAIKQSDLVIFTYVAVGDVDTGLDKDLVYNFKVELRPTIKEIDFSNFEVSRYEADITDDYLNEVVDNIRLQYATVALAEEGYKTTKYDLVKINSTITTPDGSVQEKKDMTVAINSMYNNIVDNFIGKQVGEFFEFDLEEQGQKNHHKVEVLEIQKRTIPELNEAFFKKVGVKEFTLDAFKAEVKSNLEREKNLILQYKNNNAVFDALRAYYADLKLPSTYIEREAEKYEKEKLPKDAKHTDEQKKSIHENVVKQLTEQLRLDLVVQELVEKFKINAEQEDVLKYIRETVAIAYDQPDEFIDYVLKNRQIFASYFNQYVTNQIVNLILEKAKVKEEKVDLKELLNKRA